MIALSKDRVVASRMPNSWHLGAIFGQGMSPVRSSSLSCTLDLTLPLTWWSPRTCPTCAHGRSFRPGRILILLSQAFVCHESTLILTWYAPSACPARGTWAPSLARACAHLLCEPTVHPKTLPHACPFPGPWAPLLARARPPVSTCSRHQCLSPTSP